MVTNQSKPTFRPTSDEKFINPFTDYGFKRIFGTELSKDILIAFLNSLIPEADIENLTYLNVEDLPVNRYRSRYVFDLLCQNSKQEYFLVDREKYLQREDLIFAGRTLFGAPAPKGRTGFWLTSLRWWNG